MKKILMLGGSLQQVVAIKKAKAMGYYVITVDYCPDNPGHKFADEYHNISTTDKEAVLKLAKKLKIDGIVCYASDPAASTQAYVAEQMNLYGNPYKSVEILSNKDLFRKFLLDNNFNTPKALGFSSYENAIEKINEFKFPVIVKPVDSSGSKGVSKCETIADLKKIIENALNYSRCGRFIIEEFVEKYGYQVAGDGFSVDGKLVYRAFANDHFDPNGINPYVPIAASWPYDMPNNIHQKIHNEIQRAFDLLQLKTGAYNFDILIDKDMNVYLMEIGARNGGNMIPQVMKYCTNIDIVEYTIKAAMGEKCDDLLSYNQKGFWAYYAIHRNKEGVFKELYIDEQFKEKNLVEIHMNYKIGDKVPSFVGSNGTIGIMILKFESKRDMFYKIKNMEKYVKIICEGD